MRIIFLQDHLGTGGAAIAARRYAEALRSLGHEITIVAGDARRELDTQGLTGKPPRGVARMLEVLLPVHIRRRLRKAKVAEQWEKILERIRPDLVWAHNLHGGEKWGWRLDLLTDALAHGPVLWTLHDMWALGQGAAYFPEAEIARTAPTSPLHRLQNGSFAKDRLRLTAPSQWLCRLVEESTGLRCRKWECVMDPGEFTPERRGKARRQLGLQASDFLLIAVAENLADPRKGVDLLLAAWKRWRNHEAFSSVRLGLIGRGGRKLLEGDPKVLGLGEAEDSNKVAAWLSAADLYVHTASMDNFPLTVQEAQACGTPVLAFDRGGLAEALEPDHTGWLLSERSAEVLGKKLVELLAKPSMVTRMRKPARTRILQRQNPSTFARDWKSVLQLFPPGTFPCP